MRKKDKIDEWISSEYGEKEEELFQKIQRKLNLPDPAPKRKCFSARKLWAICAPVAASVFIGIPLILYFAVFKPSPVPTPPNKNRYCSQEDYKPATTEYTLKEYSQHNNNQILYFDWYEKADEVISTVFTLNETGETIAFKEQIVNGETGNIVSLGFSDIYTEIEEFSSYTQNCKLTHQIGNTTIYWAYNRSDGQMYWEYEGYRYYLTVIGPTDSTSALALISELFE